MYKMVVRTLTVHTEDGCSHTICTYRRWLFAYYLYIQKMVVRTLTVHTEDTMWMQGRWLFAYYLYIQKMVVRIISVHTEDGCSHTNCTYRRHGVPCSLPCSKCNGVTCGNSKEPEIVDDED